MMTVDDVESNGEKSPQFPKKMWQPKGDATQIDRFIQYLNSNCGCSISDYASLYDWSVSDIESFWSSWWTFSGLLHSRPADVILEDKPFQDIPAWFEGARLNYAENLLRYRDTRTAVYITGEGRELETVTFRELFSGVEEWASALQAAGVRCNDRVAGYLPNALPALQAMLAASSIGAIWSCTSPDFGVTGVVERLSQVEPCLLISVEAVRYNGKIHDNLEKLSQVVQGCPSLRKVVLVPFCMPSEHIDLSHIPNSMFVSDFLSLGKDADGVPSPLTFTQLPFSHPLFIMFSSGTTGKPKCMVHSAGGTLMQHLKEHVLHGNMDRRDILMYYTTTGWMMWNWTVSALAVGCALVLYDGSPLLPSPLALWNLIDLVGITILGGGAKYFDLLEQKNVRPKENAVLSTLRALLSTGSPLKPNSYRYIYQYIKSDIMVGSITGGTDIISLFGAHNTNLPVYEGEIQCRGLGMAVEAWDDTGKAVWGERGELVCTRPFPCMPTHFWKDPDGSRYRNAYFNKFNGVWAHGDFCYINADTGGIVMLGRSDGVLNPSGVRFGSAEIYNIVEQFSEVDDSLCVGQVSEKTGEERVILFVKLADASSDVVPEELINKIKSTVKLQLSPRHVPPVILTTPAIPYTVSGKKVEVAVKQIIAGKTVNNKGALINPNALQHYHNVQQLQGW